MNLFNLQDHVAELRNNSKKSIIIEKYEKLVESFDDKDVNDLLFYKEYYSKIKVFPFIVPEMLENDFDWDLLAKLVIGSFSSDFSYESNGVNSDTPELIIHVKSGDQCVSKKISELWSFQITRLFEIYIEEATNLQSLKAEDDNEKSTIDEERMIRLKKWINTYSQLSSEFGNKEMNQIKDQLDKFINL